MFHGRTCCPETLEQSVHTRSLYKLLIIIGENRFLANQPRRIPDKQTCNIVPPIGKPRDFPRPIGTRFFVSRDINQRTDRCSRRFSLRSSSLRPPLPPSSPPHTIPVILLCLFSRPLLLPSLAASLSKLPLSELLFNPAAFSSLIHWKPWTRFRETKGQRGGGEREREKRNNEHRGMQLEPPHSLPLPPLFLHSCCCCCCCCFIRAK